MFFHVVTTPDNIPLWFTAASTDFGSSFLAKEKYGINLWETMKNQGYKVERFSAQKV